ncbi:MAG: hypothetical protein QOD57_5290 [Actinomycetota bacterium]|nr:hypothetical protein [Actinomycetota bacterium]
MKGVVELHGGRFRPHYDSAVTAITSTVTLPGGLTLSYAEQGDRSGPVLVLLPGPTDSWRSYEPILETITSSIRTVAVSQRGHGDSDKPATGYRVEDFAADIVPLFDARRIERAILAGHSGSCLVARRVAIDRPERIAGLVLEASPTTLHGDVRLEAFLESVVSRLEDPIDPGFARSFLVGTSSEQVPPELRDRLVGELVKVPARVWREMFAELLTYDDTGELGRVVAPTVLIWGDADGLISRVMQDQLAQRIPEGELLVYAGIGHTPRWEGPSPFASDVAAFVERLAAETP